MTGGAKRDCQSNRRPDYISTFAGRGLQKLVECLFKHPRWLCYPQLLLVLACVVYTATSLKLSTDRSDLVSSQERYRRNFLELKQEFRLPELLMVTVESESPERNRQFVERLAARLRNETNLITRVYFKGDLKLLGAKAMLFMPEEVLAGLYQTLQTNRALIRVFSQATNLNALIELVNRQFGRLRTAPAGLRGDHTLARAVPSLQRLVDKATECIKAPEGLPMAGIAVWLGADRGADQYARYLSFASGKIFVLTAEATDPERETAAIIRLRALVEQTQNEVPGLNLGLTGESVLRHDEMEQARRDTQTATVISLLLTALILMVGYHEFRHPLMATLCLLVGLGYTLGFATLSVGRLNLLSITLVPILIGLAIDFGVHLMSRYEEEVRNGGSSRAAIQQALGFTGVGVVTSALTTAGAFFTMMLADLKGIQQMGLIAGTGMLVCLVPMLTLLPLMLLRVQPDRPETKRGKPSRRSWMITSLACSGHNQRVSRFQTNRRAWIEQLFLNRPWTVLLSGVTLTVFSFLQLPKVYFDYNLQNLQTRDLPAVEIENKLIRTGAQSVLSCSVIASSLSKAAAMERQILRLPSVASVTSLVQYLTEDQERKLSLVRGIKEELGWVRLLEPDPQAVEIRTLDQSLLILNGYLGLAIARLESQESGTALAMQLSSLRDSLSQLRTCVARGDPRTIVRLTAFQLGLFRDLQDCIEVISQQDDCERLRWEDIPPFLRERFMSPSGRFMLQVHPKQNVWQRNEQAEFVRELRTVDPNVTGSPVQFYESTMQLKDGFQKAAGYALGIVAVLVFLHFRRLDTTALALFPVLVGYCWMLGLMGWIGLPFNPVNIASLALLVGIGVTNGVHVLNRFVEEDNPVVLTKSTGKAVLVSALTTMAGFGSLMVAKHQGIASLGAVMSIGTATCMIAALVFLPAVLNLLGRIGWSLTSKGRR
jgi:uncharacterized protein